MNVEEEEKDEGFDIIGDSEDEEGDDGEKKKDKKLVFLSRSVLEKIREKPMTTGTQIANEILELYRQFSDVSLSAINLAVRKLILKMYKGESTMHSTFCMLWTSSERTRTPFTTILTTSTSQMARNAVKRTSKLLRNKL